MKGSFVNEVHVEGYIFDHTLQVRKSKKGVTYIGGIINVATDDEALNVVPVSFSYVAEVYTKSEKPNPNYGILERIIEENNTFTVNGTEAQKVRIDGNIEVNDFVTRDGEMASPKRVRGGFIHFMKSTDNFQEKPATFDVDMLISAAIEHDTDENSEDNSYLTLKGYAFDFRNNILPIELSISDKAGMQYFLDQDISQANPLCTRVWGSMKTTTLVKEETVESAFGAARVNNSTRTFRSWDIQGCSTEPYTWDDEEFITKAELKQALADREEVLADVRKRNEEYHNSRKGQAGFPAEIKAETKSAPAETKSAPAEDDYLF